MAAVARTTACAAWPRPGRSRNPRGRNSNSRRTSGSRPRGLSRGGVGVWPTEMIAKAYNVDLGLGVPEKKKKKKKKVGKEPETQYSILKDDKNFTQVSPRRSTSPSKNVVQGQVPTILVLKKKKKKKGHSTHISEDHLEPETVVQAKWSEKSPSSRQQVLGPSEFLHREKKKKRKGLSNLAMAPSLGRETSPDCRQSEEVARVGKKLKKHKKEKKTQCTVALPAQSPCFCEAEDALCTGSTGRLGEEQVASGQKRKQGSSREHSIKMKKKKTHQERDATPGHAKGSRSMKSSLTKGSKKKLVKVEAPEYIPIGDGPQASVKKKTKSKKLAEQPSIDKLALKRKKKKMKESEVVEEPHDKMRRKALQEEIDRESGKTEASETRTWTGTQFGQWDTAGFENEQQKLKFLKLMGGFKNLSPSFSCPPSRMGRPNMALSKQAADTLQQNLQQDYDRAMSWKYNRGSGLGFSTAPTKIFYIDRNASRSIKYED
ncbi:lysine-rich nucleolar protein 1 isoform X2 [Choloepus didactylus]|uniref:lysine-rich nucleolar protein 1 isoform X2 n=1 Tax=Choloepus didactylus TaxID=27675 RepID=UPI00189E48C5|nr:lysine-rich nucleolar protein 1 isoform X2 [Choloepus didactylus]